MYGGEWENDKKHGQGTEKWANGNSYRGAWEDGVRHGQGEMAWIDGAVYVGEWKNDERHGEGTMTSHSGRVFAGQWREDCEHGKNKVASDAFPPVLAIFGGNCPGKHGLSRNQERYEFDCDRCDKVFSGRTARWSCGPCDYDLCDACGNPRYVRRRTV